MRTLTIALILFAPAVMAQDNFHVTVGSMSINGLSGRGTVIEAGVNFSRVTIAAFRNESWATQQAQNVRSDIGAYGTFNVIQTEKWQAGLGAAYLDYQVTDHHNFRRLFGVPPLTGDSDPLEFGLTINRRFGPLMIGLRHFGFTTLAVGVGF